MTKKQWIAALSALLITASLCLFLYLFDNKYTHPGPQPISGVLYLTEDDFSGDSLHYLIRDWMFYPDVLLTPDQVSAEAGYRRYVDIGGRDEMSHGSGTYQLTLMLPEEEHQYAIGLPEIYSACALYINNSKLLQLGDPVPERYEEDISCQVVSFSAAGQTELLLQVSDFSGVCSGLTFPPSFGTTSSVLSALDGQQLLHSVGVLLSLLGALLALTFGFYENRTQGFIMSLTCLCLAVSTGYPLLHSLLHTSYQPWYTLEAGCSYALLMLAVLLQSDALGSRKTRILLVLPCGIGFFCALFRFGGAAIWPPELNPVFSCLSILIKFYSAACLVVLSVKRLLEKESLSVMPLCGSTALSTCLICDRLFPLYEPIRSGWFTELGGILLVSCLGISIWLRAIDACRFHLNYKDGYQQMERRLEMQKAHYCQFSEQLQRSREASHDLRHHMRTLRVLAQQGQLEELTAYLDTYEPHTADAEVQVWCENPTADAVLSYYAAEAKKLGACYDVQLALPEDLSFPEDALCILLGNILENAVEAMEHQTSGRRQIFLRGDVTGNQLRLVVDNSFSGQIRMQGDRFLSTKHHGIGLGISSVKALVAQYGGLVDFSADHSTFHVSVLIPLPR